MKKVLRASAAVNIVGAVGYMFLVAAWAFFIAISFALLFDPSMKAIPTDIVQNPAAPTSGEPSLALVVVSYVIAGVFIAASVVIMVTLPYFIGKWGARVLRRLMAMLKIPMTKRQLFLVKCILATLPLLGLMIVNYALAPESMTFAAMYVATIAVSVASISAFLVQLVIARRLNIATNKVW